MIIRATIEMGDDYLTVTAGETIEEVLEKIKQFHTMSQFQKKLCEKRGTLEGELATGWYMKQ